MRGISDNAETSPEIIELRSRLGTAQETLNIEFGLSGYGQPDVSGGSVSSSASTAGSILQAATGGGGGGSISGCFGGKTNVTRFDGTKIPFKTLYELPKDQWPKVRSFHDNQIVEGEIEEVFRRTAPGCLIARFSDNEASWVIGLHKYFTEDGKYVPIERLIGRMVMNDTNKAVKVTMLEYISVPIDVYNLSIKKYRNYVADNKRVHNLKDPDDEPLV